MSAGTQNAPAPKPPKRKKRRWLLKLVGTFLALLILAGVSALLVVRSAWFSNKVRERIVTEIEKASGGRTAIGSFQFDWRTMKATAGDVVLHGMEEPNEAPLVRTKRIEVHLAITSVLHAGIHVRSIRVEQPAVHLISTKDGRTNLPTPKVRETVQDFIDTLLEVAASEVTIHNGSLDLNDRHVPFDLTARDVDINLRYNTNRKRPVYYGDVQAKQFTVEAPGLDPKTFALDSSVSIEHGTVTVTKAKLSTKQSRIEVSGLAYHLLSPSSNFSVNASVALAEFGKTLGLPIEHRGVVDFDGKVSIDLSGASMLKPAATPVNEQFRYSLAGRLKGRGLAIREGQVSVDGVTLDSLVTVAAGEIRMKRLQVAALGGEFEGSGELIGDFKKLAIEGVIRNFATARLLIAAGRPPQPYVSIASGPIRFNGLLDKTGVSGSILNAAIALASAAPETSAQIPLEGLVNLTWTQSAQTIDLKESHLATPSSSVDVSGTLGQRLEVTAHTTRLEDVEPLLRDSLPIRLEKGSADFQGAVIGPIDNPRLEGTAALTHFVNGQQSFDSLTADFSLTRDLLQAKLFKASQGPFKVEGAGSIHLENWKANEHSAFTAKLNVRNARIETLLAEVKQSGLPVTGAVSLTANLSGSVARLAGDAQIEAQGVSAWDEQIDRVKATLALTADRVDVTAGSALFHNAEIPFRASYTHKPDDWKSGVLSFNTKAQGFDLLQSSNFSKRWPQWKGVLNATVAASGSLDDTGFHLTSLNTDATLGGLAYEGREVGSVDLRATSTGVNLNLIANGTIRGGRMRVTGDWKLEGDCPGGGEITTTSVSIQTLRDLLVAGEHQPLPFQSAIEAAATFKVPLRKPDQLTADLKIQRLFVAPGAAQRLGAGAKEQDLILENARPVVLHVTPSEAVLEPALFHATNTSVEVGGRIAFEPKLALDLTLKGGLNLGELQMFKLDLVASGTASIDAAIRGNLTDPQVNGSLTVSKASLYFGDLPVGLDNLNGSVSFDRNRATIQSVAAESGGGRIGLTGFIGFGGPALVYRLQGKASSVRVRYPEGASTTVNAEISLTGTSQESLLAGTVTIVRAALTPRSDLASLMAALTKPGAASAPRDNDYIRGMHLDVRLESSPNLEFQTSVTRGLQADVDLRLQGTAVRPTLLGTVGFSEGEISLFGNNYTLTRGEIRFFNPTRIEPVFDLEAETRARGIDVNISFSGTPSKLNVSYRSDPPLQPNDIIALLAVGRDPNIAAGLASSQMTQQGSGLGDVVGEALTSSMSNRLQKFFGVTRLKIDPQLTGLDNIPQARLTVEQQLSKDITLTFITNVARTSEQIVRIQWDFTREWSGIAVRDENGLFGVDVQYRKRFK